MKVTFPLQFLEYTRDVWEKDCLPIWLMLPNQNMVYLKKKKKTQLLEKSSLISTTNIINMFNFNLVKDL